MGDTNVPKHWNATKIASQKGKKAIVTGANSGIGFVTALELAPRRQRRARVSLSPDAGNVEFRKLDVSSLASVQAFADDFKSDNDCLDLMINNAGIMGASYSETVDGYESLFATNHLGHFALTSQLLPLLQNSKAARVVNVSSMSHQTAKVDLNEIMTPQEKYSEHTVYGNSKVYNLLFTFELNRRFQAKGSTNVMATAAHPGFTSTNISDELFANANWFTRPILKLVWSLPIIQTPDFGALPTLYAAVGENMRPSDYIGPRGFLSLTGYPTKQEPKNVSKSKEHAAKLWEDSEKLAKLTFAIETRWEIDSERQLFRFVKCNDDAEVVCH